MDKLYESNLLGYLTGNSSQQEGNRNPYYNVTEYNFDNTLFDYLTERVGGAFEINGSVQCKDGKGQPNGKMLFWGYASETVGTFLLLTDYNFTPIALIDSYSSGSSLFDIATIEVADDGTMYGLDYQTEGTDLDLTYRFRIVLFNNISEIPKGYSTYTCILRNSYYIQGLTANDSLNMVKPPYIKKSPQSATYFYSISNEELGVTNMAGTFKINVGSANEWVRFPDVTFADYSSRVINAYFDAEDIVHATYYEPYINAGNDSALFVTYTIGDSEPSGDVLINNIDSMFITDPTDTYTLDIVPINNYFYMIFRGCVKHETAGSVRYKQKLLIYVVHPKPKLLVDYEPITYIQEEDIRNPEIHYSLVNGNLVYFIYWAKYDRPSVDSILYGFTNEKNDIEVLVDTGAITSSNDYPVFNDVYCSSNAFNLYTSSIYAYVENEEASMYQYALVKGDLIYNEDNYNGEEYSNINLLKGKQGILYDDTFKPIFARNLYNYKTYNNRVISTLNVPYNMLNDTEISSELLLSETNANILGSHQAIHKNMYENLFINFFITISMVNQNENTEISNKEGAIRITQSAFNINDYENAKATKAQINYSDDTNMVISVQPTNLGTSYQYQIGVYAPTDKEIDTIDIKSEDEVTTYTTISNNTIKSMEMTPGKYYYIYQHVMIQIEGNQPDFD